eukprot:scaffold143_cov260-Pinguiococcus_pyrenoidosus.AAC.36
MRCEQVVQSAGAALGKIHNVHQRRTEGSQLRRRAALEAGVVAVLVQLQLLRAEAAVRRPQIHRQQRHEFGPRADD